MTSLGMFGPWQIIMLLFIGIIVATPIVVIIIVKSVNKKRNKQQELDQLENQ